MIWIDATLEALAAAPVCGYRARGPACTEPTALAALALRSRGRRQVADQALRWLAERQNPDGSLGINAQEPSPGWPTALAVLAWRSAQADGTAGARGVPGSAVQAGRPGATAVSAVQAGRPFRAEINRAVSWLLDSSGVPVPRRESMGHDSTLIGWSWAEGTHSWVEPTAWAVLALAATGRSDHPRYGEASRLLADRLLPQGGCNYGNTVVLGQTLRPHLLPTAMALLALSRQEDRTGRIGPSLDYLDRELTPETAAVSLACGVMALAAHDRRPSAADDWLAAAAGRELARDAAPFRLALLALAAADGSNPLLSPAAGVAQ